MRFDGAVHEMLAVDLLRWVVWEAAQRRSNGRFAGPAMLSCDGWLFIG